MMLPSSTDAPQPPPPCVVGSSAQGSGTEHVTHWPASDSLPRLIPNTSGLPHAGMGLFTGEDITQGSLLVEYYGEILSLSQARRVRDRTYLKVVNFNRHINAGGDNASIARFINDNIDTSAINAEFIKLSRPADDNDDNQNNDNNNNSNNNSTTCASTVSSTTDKHATAVSEASTTAATAASDNKKSKKKRTEERIFIRAISDIAKGDELFVSYGRSHWLFGGVPAFLGLEVKSTSTTYTSTPTTPRGVVATVALEKSEVVCMYSTTFLLLDEDQEPLGTHLCFSAVESLVNCRLQRNPFIRDTTMVVASRPIEAGESLLLPTHNRLVVQPSTMPNAGNGAFARVPIYKGDALGAYKGTVLTMAGFRNKLSRAPGAAGYAFQFNVKLDKSSENENEDVMQQMVVDPTDDKGQVRPGRQAGVCFINEHSATRDDPAHNCRFQFRGASALQGAHGGGQEEWMVQVVATADVPQGQELFLHYGEHFHRDWVVAETTAAEE